MFQLHRTDRWLPILFFATLLVIGIIVHRDYGISWDEPEQRRLGLATWDYISGTNTDLLKIENRYHNPFIELLELLPEKILHIKSERAIYLSRHLFNFIFCWAGFIFFYLLALQLFKDYRFALLACLLFMLMPRLAVHSFYNSKDLPFLSLFVVNMYLFIRWLAKPSWITILLLTFFSGLLTGARIAGILFPLMAIVVFVLHSFQRKITGRELKMMSGFILLYPLAVYIFFPTFWHHPFSEFSEAVKWMSSFPLDVETFFMGGIIHSLKTPWYYALVWMAIVIPVGWWLFFIVGLIGLFIVVFRRRIIFMPPDWMLILLWFFVPLSVAILFHSALYDDARHMFFIYPPFIFIAVYGFRALIQIRIPGNKIRLLIRGSASLIFLTTAAYLLIFMIRFHPFQYAYFNFIGRKYANDYFEKDYWGLSYRNALEFLVKYDHSNQINVNWRVDPGEWNLAWLNGYDRQRIHLDRHEGHYDYYITNFRKQHPVDASDEKIYEVNVQGITIMAVYKMPLLNSAAPPTQ